MGYPDQLAFLLDLLPAAGALRVREADEEDLLVLALFAVLGLTGAFSWFIADKRESEGRRR